jgi:hypothetical protein
MYFRRALMIATISFLIGAISACSSLSPIPASSLGSRCELENQPLSTDKSRRPFYIIGHNPNNAADAIRQLRMGFNALGPDLRFVNGELRVDNQFMLGNIAIQWPRHLGVGPTMENYLRALRTELTANAMLPPTLIVWDLKPPFSITWMREALRTARTEFTHYHPNTAIAFTVGEIEGAAEITKLASDLKSGEAIGIDDYYEAQQNFDTFASLDKPYVYANRDRAWSMNEALAMRSKSNAFPFIFAWTINSPSQMQAYLLQGIDGMIVDEHALPHLCKLLTQSPNSEKFRKALIDDKPF